MFRAQIIIEEIKKYHPEIFELAEACIKDIEYDLDFQRLNNEPFSQFPNISIDVAVMEKTNLGTVISLDAGWSDIGSWKSVWKNSEKDANGNVLEGNVVIKNTKNSYLKSENRLIVGLGLDDHIVIETNDAILIADKNEDQKVKEILEELKSKNIPEFSTHKKVHRPWGYYTSISENRNWQVKVINVNPGGQISLQRHRYRAEHWIVVNGIAKVEINEKKFILNENESSFIPIGAMHRLSNPGEIVLSIIEIQSGSYLGEDDIERFEDNYGRTT
jgi:mannose-1-phosphate guanylyltransferase